MAARKKHGAPSAKDKIIAALRKKFGAEAATTLTESRAIGQITNYIPTGIDVLDNYVIPGGLPEGRWSEWFGMEGCGKTALLYHCLASCQRIGGMSVLVDAEHSFDEKRAKLFGVNIDDLIIIEPENLEICLDEIRTTITTHDGKTPMLIGWDSVAAVATDKESKRDASDKKHGPSGEAMVFSREMKKINRMLSKKRVHVMMLNQVRTKFGVIFGDNTSTPGGNAIKFFASIRVQYFGGKALKDAKKKHTGKVLTLIAIKTRLSEPWRKARIRFDYAFGYNNLWSTIEHAKNEELIDPRENGYAGRGKEGLDAYKEALIELGWKPSAPMPKPIEVDDDAEEEEDEDEE